MINGIYFISNFPFHLLVYVTLLILPQNMFSCHNWVMHQRFPIEILPMHIHSSNLMIFIGRIIVNSSVCIAAGSVDSDLILPFVQLTASSGLIHAPQNMEKLADACCQS